jgi:myo-inositol-1(or 4)-monophosphatase
MPAGPADQLARDHALVTEAVREAGAVAMRYFRGPVAQWEKGPGDPVSEADHAVNDFLRARLGGARPDYGWLSEESEDDKARLGAERVWIVDPIDGTRAFLKGKPEFTVCVALAGGGRALAGAVYNPATDEFFEARAGAGARLNGRPLAVSAGGRGDGLRLLASRRTFEKQRWLKSLPGADFHAINSIAYRLALVAAGRFDAAISLSPKSDWDVAAAHLLVSEAGGRMTTADGAGLVYNRAQIRHPSVLAASPALHRRLVALIGVKS